MTGTDHYHDGPEVEGKPIGRRTILGLIGLAGAGVVGGKAIQDGLAKILAPGPVLTAPPDRGGCRGTIEPGALSRIRDIARPASGSMLPVRFQVRERASQR